MRQLYRWGKVALPFFLVVSLWAQGTGTIIRVLPDQQATQEGGIIFTSRDGYPATEKSAILGAPSTMPSGTYSMRLPTNLEADTRCLQVTSAGQIELATGSCGVGGGGDVFTDQPNVFTASPQTIDITGDQARFHFISDYDNAGAAGVINGRSYSSTGGFGLVIKGFSMRGTEASPAATGSGQNLIWFGGGGHDGTVEAHNAAVITAKAISAWSGTNRGSYWSIFTTPDGSTSAAERFFFGLDSPGAITMLNDEPLYMRNTSGSPLNAIRMGSTNQLLVGEVAMAGILLGDNTNVLGNFLPNTNNLYDMGSLTFRFNESYLQAARLGVGSVDQIVLDGNRGPSSVGDTLKINTSGGVNRISMGVTDSQNDTIISLQVSGSAGDVAINADNGVTGSGFFIGGLNIIKARGSAVANCVDVSNTCTQLNALLARLRPAGHGLIAD